MELTGQLPAPAAFALGNSSHVPTEYEAGCASDPVSMFCKKYFWRRSARISRKDKIRNNIIKQKMNVTGSLLEDINTKQLNWYGHVQRMEEGILPKKSYEMEPTRKNEVDLNLPGRKRLED